MINNNGLKKLKNGIATREMGQREEEKMQSGEAERRRGEVWKRGRGKGVRERS
jgi:hypothetical protein